MTDLNERLAAMLEGEPIAPYDLDRVVAGGRRALRRRTAFTAVVGTAGTAAVTAAVVVPIAANGHGGGVDKVTVLSSPTPAKTDSVRCEFYLQKLNVKSAQAAEKRSLQRLMHRAEKHYGAGTTVETQSVKRGQTIFLVCPRGASAPPLPGGGSSEPTPSAPSYHYLADPQAIANGFADELDRQVRKLGLSIVSSRPFAQETSTLEKGHPSYFDGNVDVQLPNGPANIGVQVTHAVTEQVPFDGTCSAPRCTQYALADGSTVQVRHIDAGSDGAEVIAVEIHHPDGLVVEAQEANYGFGPEATKARSSQPMTIDQLTALAMDPAWTF
jgi:hypothetical protein